MSHSSSNKALYKLLPSNIDYEIQSVENIDRGFKATSATIRLACETADACDKRVSDGVQSLEPVNLTCTQLVPTRTTCMDSSIGRIMCVSTASSIRDTQSDRRRRTMNAVRSLASRFVEFYAV